MKVQLMQDFLKSKLLNSLYLDYGFKIPSIMKLLKTVSKFFSMNYGSKIPFQEIPDSWTTCPSDPTLVNPHKIYDWKKINLCVQFWFK